LARRIGVRDFANPQLSGSQAWGEIEVMTAGFQCAGCGEWNSTSVDETAGRDQTYVEDCQVCCRPNLLRIRYCPEEDAFVIAAQLE